MHHIYCKDIDPHHNLIRLVDPREIHHLKNVVRGRKGAIVSFFDGKNTDGTGIIAAISSDEITIDIQTIRSHPAENPLLTLACAIPKKSKFETIIEKATELGVNRIIPLQTERTEVIISQKKVSSKQDRFQTVALNAAKQSKRFSLPRVERPQALNTVLDQANPEAVKIIPSLQEDSQALLPVLDANSSADEVMFFIGPEGDFTEQEYAHASLKGCIPVTLGKTVLKVETAALCALSAAGLFLRT